MNIFALVYCIMQDRRKLMNISIASGICVLEYLVQGLATTICATSTFPTLTQVHYFLMHAS